MDENNIERAAMQAAHTNQLDPPSDLLDSFLYLALYELYATLYAGQLTRDQARPIKLKLLARYRKQKAAYDFDMKLRRSAVALWKNTEAASNQYALDRTLDNADELWAVIVNMTKDTKPIRKEK